jgi:cytochrome c
MRALRFVVAILGAIAAGAVLAQSGADVVKAKGCLNCHAVGEKKIGPSYKELAAKYKGDAKAAGMLAAKLQDGKGHPKVEASDAEIKAAVNYVLSQKLRLIGRREKLAAASFFCPSQKKGHPP